MGFRSGFSLPKSADASLDSPLRSSANPDPFKSTSQDATCCLFNSITLFGSTKIINRTFDFEMEEVDSTFCLCLLSLKVLTHRRRRHKQKQNPADAKKDHREESE